MKNEADRIAETNANSQKMSKEQVKIITRLRQVVSVARIRKGEERITRRSGDE